MKVFISHSHQDMLFVEKLKPQLEALNISVVSYDFKKIIRKNGKSILFRL